MNSLMPPLHVRAGAPLGQTVHHHRADLAQALAERTPLAELPDVLGRAYNLCGRAHTLAARLALAAVGTLAPVPSGESLRALHAETWLEHTRRLHLDWPRLLLAGDPTLADGQSAALQALRRCPVPLHQPLTGLPCADALRALTEWQVQSALGQSVDTWLGAWNKHGVQALAEWAARADTWLARTLRRALAVQASLAPERHTRCAALEFHHDADRCAAFAEAVLAQPTLAAEPVIDGAPCHTGTWSRGHGPAATLLAMLGRRIAEWLRLLMSATRPLLATQARRCGQRAAWAWVEMARGLLLHVVELGTDGGVARYRVVAPTEWNFHPLGAAARRISDLRPMDAAQAAQQVSLVMAAYDPCVPFIVEPAELPKEVLHA